MIPFPPGFPLDPLILAKISARKTNCHQDTLLQRIVQVYVSDQNGCGLRQQIDNCGNVTNFTPKPPGTCS